MHQFLASGYTGTTTREIAREAGTSESGVFRVYPSKYDLLMGVYDACWAQVNLAVGKAMANCGRDPRERICKTVETLWKLYGDESCRKTMSFVLMNIGNTDTLLIEHREQVRITEENQKFVQQVHGLAAQAESMKLLPRGITGGGLAEAVLGISEGFLLGWYLADRSSGSYPRIPTSEARAVLKQLVWGELPNLKGGNHAKHRNAKSG
jgi:AcrR family transcriptional regulator